MYFSNTIMVAGVLAPLVSAHGGAPIPNVFGLGNVRDLKARDLLSNLKARTAAAYQLDTAETHVLEKRRDAEGRCGGVYGSCAAGECCSEAGWCGTTSDDCYSPGCQFKYGPGCYENRTPAGASTSTVARPKVGNIPYGGAGIYSCNNPGTIAITYDDGPFTAYTAHILDTFASYGGKATFFITGANIGKGQIDTTPEFTSVIRRAYNEGHQIASHTWTHLDLSAITSAQRKEQMYKNEMALRNILGFFPTYMRPPYSSCTAASGCEADMAALGYHVTYFDVDTDDYNQATPSNIQNSKNWFNGNITAGGATPANNDWLAIGHDIHEQTAYNLTDYMLSRLTQLGYRAVTVGECLNDPVANWYRGSTPGTVTTSRPTTQTPTSTSTAPPSTATKISTDAKCGSNGAGATCLGSIFGNCCSSAGWCGSTSIYCGTGCQPGFGTCGGTGTITSSAATPTGTKTVSPDGMCAGTNQYTCQGSVFGNCCSQYGWCGSTTGHCGTGCQAAFGTCS